MPVKRYVRSFILWTIHSVFTCSVVRSQQTEYWIHSNNPHWISVRLESTKIIFVNETRMQVTGRVMVISKKLSKCTLSKINIYLEMKRNVNYFIIIYIYFQEISVRVYVWRASTYIKLKHRNDLRWMYMNE